MNVLKIAAALHALADAFLDSETGLNPSAESAAPAPKKARKAAIESAPPAATPAAPATPAPAAASPPAQPPAAPTIPIAALNNQILKLAGKDRDKALAVLAEFKVLRTPELKSEQYQAVFDRIEEELAKIDAASVQASLV